MAIGDFDSNGLIDLFFPSTGSDNANVLFNKSTISNLAFESKFNVIKTEGSRPFYVAVSNHASPQMYTLNREAPGYIYLVKLEQSINFTSKVISSVSQNATAISVGDMDGDGVPEPFVTGEGLTFPNALLFDVDGDGKTDVVTLSPTLPQISIYRNTSVPGSVSYATPVNITVDKDPVAVTTIDVDEDGKLDLAVSCSGVSPQTTGSIIILKNGSSNGTVSLSPVYTISGIPSVSSVAAGDLNSDGHADLLVASGTDKSVAYKNVTNGAINFSGGISFDLPGKNGLIIVDMDGDGKTDLCGLANSDLFILRNTSGQTAITSFSPGLATAGNEVLINGAKFSKATSVSFGGVEAKSFIVVSDTQIKAIVNEPIPGEYSTGLVKVSGSEGNAFYSGFIYATRPVITPNGSTIINKGGSLLLSSGSYSEPVIDRKWYRNGDPIAGVTGREFTATQSGKYTFSVTVNGTVLISDPVWITIDYQLPANNFKISALSLTCKGADNGVITITTEKELDYNVLIKGGNIANTNYQFKKTKQITGLKGGLYTLVFTLTNEPEFEQEFTIKVDQPKDLIVYQEVDPVVNTVMLTLEGGDKYNVTLNGFMYTTTASQLRLSLARGTNELIVTTDKDCQGVIKKLIKVDGASVYPVPFTDWLNVDLGDDKAELVPVELLNIYGKVILSISLENQNGKGRLNLSSIPSGTYVLKVRSKVYKIWKQ